MWKDLVKMDADLGLELELQHSEESKIESAGNPEEECINEAGIVRLVNIDCTELNEFKAQVL